VSGHPKKDCGCDPELVFELADGTLDPAREREVRTHLDECPGCRQLYERDVSLSAFLGSVEFAELRSRSVCREVAMAIPTRPARARLLWGALALGLLMVALLALHASGVNPAGPVAGLLGVFLSVTSGFADAALRLLGMASSIVLVALLAGAVADLLIAAAIFSAARRSREA
jgi:anti-sigma factor RsiW